FFQAEDGIRDLIVTGVQTCALPISKQLGLDVKVAANGDALMGLLESAPKLVIVDLNARSQPLQAIARVRQASKDIRVVGFVSHVQTQLAAQAQAAGCNEVLPRSSFAQNLEIGRAHV